MPIIPKTSAKKRFMNSILEIDMNIIKPSAANVPKNTSIIVERV